jgi:hypothetical protein
MNSWTTLPSDFSYLKEFIGLLVVPLTMVWLVFRWFGVLGPNERASWATRRGFALGMVFALAFLYFFAWTNVKPNAEPKCQAVCQCSQPGAATEPLKLPRPDEAAITWFVSLGTLIGLLMRILDSPWIKHRIVATEESKSARTVLRAAEKALAEAGKKLSGTVDEIASADPDLKTAVESLHRAIKALNAAGDRAKATTTALTAASKELEDAANDADALKPANLEKTREKLAAATKALSAPSHGSKAGADQVGASRELIAWRLWIWGGWVALMTAIGLASLLIYYGDSAFPMEHELLEWGFVALLFGYRVGFLFGE